MAEKIRLRQVILYKDQDGAWCAECVSLPGCNSQGGTLEETITNIREAIKLYIEALETEGLPVPEEKFRAFVAIV